MTITPSHLYHDEFIVTPSDERGRLILDSFRPRKYSGICHLTPAKARKAEALYRFGFTAIPGDSRQCYCRNGGRTLTLDHAMMVVEVMS